MNYFAHARRFLDDAYFVAGTAVPDWLNVVDRKVRARPAAVRPFAEDADPRVASLAGGILQHHADDAWFHQSRAFVELSLQLTKTVRRTLPDDDSLRPGFLGHILVEILLDAELIALEPDRLEAYYRAVDEVDPQLVADSISRMAPRRADGLAHLIPRFSAERFLPDYLEDAKLCFRLNQVMHRVRLPQLPDSFVQIFPTARRLVRDRTDELLTPSTEKSQ